MVRKAYLYIQENIEYIITAMPAKEQEQVSQSPLSSDFTIQQKQKQHGNNYHSSSLSMMNTATVNKTNLHPGGVEYAQRLPSFKNFRHC